MTFSPDSKMLASGGKDKIIKLWDTQTGKLKQSIMGHNWDIEAIAFTPNGRYLVSKGVKDSLNEEPLGEVVVWDAITTRLMGSHGQERPMGFSIAPNSKTLISYGRGEVQVIELQTGKLMQLLGKADALVRSCAFSPDSETLAIAMESGEIEMWAPGVRQSVL